NVIDARKAPNRRPTHSHWPPQPRGPSALAGAGVEEQHAAAECTAPLDDVLGRDHIMADDHSEIAWDRVDPAIGAGRERIVIIAHATSPESASASGLSGPRSTRSPSCTTNRSRARASSSAVLKASASPCTSPMTRIPANSRHLG